MPEQEVIVRFKADVENLTKRLDQIEKEIKQIGKASDSTSKKVTSNAKKNTQALKGLDAQLDKIGSNLKGNLLNSVTGFGAALSGAFAVQRLIRDAGQRIKEFEKSISTLSSITGATGEDLDFLRRQAIAIGSATTLSATQVSEGFKLIASAKPDLLENGAALAQVTKEAITLAEASGTELAPAADALTNTLNQFSLSAEESTRVINALAAGSKFGAVAIPGISEAVVKFGTVAANANVSVEESVALVETLGEKGIPASESGIKLRNVLIRLQAGADETNPAVVGLSTALENLGKQNLSVTELTQRFGLQNVVAAQTLIENTARVDDLTEAVTGTNTALEQAIVNTDNWEGDLTKTESAYEGLVLTIESGGGVINKSLRALTQRFTEILQEATLVVDLLNAAGGDIDALAEKAAQANIDEFLKQARTQAFLLGQEFDRAGAENLLLNKAQRELADISKEVSEDTGEQIDLLSLSRKEIKELGLDFDDATRIISNKAIIESLEQNNKALEESAELTRLRALSEAELRAEIEAGNVLATKVLATKLGLNDADAQAISNSKQLGEELKKLKTALKDQSIAGDINNATVNEYLRLTGQLEVANDRLQLALTGTNNDLKAQEDIIKGINDEIAKSFKDLEDVALEAQDEIKIDTFIDEDLFEDESEQFKDEAKELTKIIKDEEKKRTDEAKKQAEIRKALLEGSIDIARDVFSTIIDLEQQQNDIATDNAIANLQEQLDNKLISEEQFADERAKILTKQAQQDKDFARNRAILDTAAAVAKALSSSSPPLNFIQAGFVGAAGAVQIAKINKQPIPQFWEGTPSVGLNGNKPGKDTVPAMLTAGERVISVADNRKNWDIYEAIRKNRFDEYVMNRYLPGMSGKKTTKAKTKSWKGENLMESEKRTRQIMSGMYEELRSLNRNKQRLHY